MRKIKILAGITALLFCMLISVTAFGELTPVSTEENGRIRETVWMDENDQPAAGPEGYSSVRYTYKGDNTYEEYFDTEGLPFCTYGGYYGRRLLKDGRGNTLEIEYLDQDGQRTLNRKGYAHVSITYYGFGEIRSVTYFGMNKKPVMVPSLGYASVYSEYSNKTMTSRTFRDTKGNPVDGADGYAAVRQKVNKRFQVMSVRYDHADGSPAAGPDGWFRCVKDRDDQGRLTSVKYYDVNMQMTDRGAGYAWEGYAYDGDNTVMSTRYDLNDRIITDDAGVATTVREMKDGRVVKESFLDEEGKRISNAIGVGEILYSYDHSGSLEKVTYRDTEGKPVKCTGGYAGYRDTKDDDGATITRTFLGTDDLAAEIPGGYSEIRYTYDDLKQLSMTRFYDLNGKQVKGE